MRSNGHVQDLRLPLEDGRADPDPDHARHAGPGRARRAPPLDRAPARRGRPPALSRREGRDRAADRERLLLRLRLPRADLRDATSSGSRRRSGASSTRAATWSARGDLPRRGARRASRPRTSRTRSSSSTPPRATSRSTRRATSPTSAAARTSRTRSRSRRSSSPASPARTGAATRRSRSSRASTAPPSTRKADLDAYLERLEEARKRDHRRLGSQLDLFHLSEHSPGSPFWHPKGMVIWNALEDLRRRENRAARLRRGEDAAALRRRDLHHLGPLRQLPRQHVLHRARTATSAQFALKPMNCPGHMLLFGSQLRSYRDLPFRYAESSTLHRDELGGTLHGLLRVKHITQDDAHIFCSPGADRGRDLRLPRLRRLPLRPVRDGGALRALDPPREQARHRRGVGLHRGRAARRRSSGARSSTWSTRATARSTARRSTCT